MSRTTDTSTIGVVELDNAGSDSIEDTQRELNAIASYTGGAINADADIKPSWASDDIGASGDSLFQRIEAIQSAVVSLTPDIMASGGVLYGQNEQDPTNFFYNSACAFLGLGTDAPSGTLDINGSLNFKSDDVSLASGVLSDSINTFVRLTTYSSGDLETIPTPIGGGNAVKLIVNDSGSDIAITDAGNIETNGVGITFTEESLILLLWDGDDSVWRILAGGGGGGSVATPVQNFSQASTTLTLENYQTQVWRFTTEDPEAGVTLTSIVFTDVPAGGIVTITSQADSEYPCVIPAGLTNIIMNGDCTLTQHSTLMLQRIGPRMIEVCRNGI